MPIKSTVTITATSEEQIKTYFIKGYEGKTIFVHTTPTKIKALIDILGELEAFDEWGELKDYNGIYEI